MRRVLKSDVEQILTLRSNPETMKFIPRPVMTTTTEALELIEQFDNLIDTNEAVNWAITLKNDSKLIGIIGFYRLKPANFRGEIGYMLLPEFQGKGIVTEAIEVAITYGFESMKLHSIEAVIDPDNYPSARVLEKNNFVKEAHFKEYEYYNGRFLDTVIYSLINK